MMKTLEEIAKDYRKEITAALMSGRGGVLPTADEQEKEIARRFNSQTDTNVTSKP